MKNLPLNEQAYVARLEKVAQQIRQGSLKEAATALNAMVRSHGQDPRVFLLGAQLAHAANNPDGALTAARKAHDLLPQWPTATIFLATVLARRGEAQEAMSLAGTAIAQALESTETGELAPAHTDLLLSAASIAQGFAIHDKAWGWLRQALKFQPDNADIRNRMARTLTFMGDPAGAIDILDELLEQKPKHPGLLFNRLQAGIQAGRLEHAVIDGEVLVALDPANAIYAFYLTMAQGATPATQPASMITETFDDYAARYDDVMVMRFKYALPRDAAKMMQEWFKERPFDVLDLGCGTGLLGISLEQRGGTLIGVDLSEQMTRMAAMHGRYHRFHVVNLLDALRDTPSSHYDVIAALDVLPYVGDLARVFPDALRILTPGGRIIVSCEAGEECQGDYCLPLTYRYTHRREYVQRLMTEAGFAEIELMDYVLRYESGVAIKGFLATGQKAI